MSVIHLEVNEQVELANKVILKGLEEGGRRQRSVGRITPRVTMIVPHHAAATTKEILFFMVYGAGAILYVEIKILS